MRAHILAGITLTILAGVQPAFSQAAAESVLLNSNSAGATVKAGTSLGNSLNKAGNRLGNQVQRTVAPQSGVNVRIERTPRIPKTSAPPAGPQTVAAAQSANGGSLITSIQGGHLSRPAASASAPEAK